MKKHSPLLEEKLNPRTKLWRMYGKVNPDQTQKFLLVSFQYVGALLENSSLLEVPKSAALHFVMPVSLHTGTQCQQSPGRIMLLAFNKSL